ncbi:DNA-binding protein [Pseudomonas quasicaspiana]|uniref:DNA-binding protein n=1 Tax=Pseudomonas quasicaspiana TaxID=2829821 RepID=UPI001E2DACE9|nr:DNA-binding protein [Pseudomonas quasicaspiana]MCD5972014.1 DNA-binding protein [Pseudomonas quasicaspiana]
MARGGINKAIVQKAREALLAKGENPSIDAVRVELGNTGSKTTIHRYLKEIEAFDPRPRASRDRLSDELTELVSRLMERLMEEGGEAISNAQAQFDQQRTELELKLQHVETSLLNLQRQFDVQGGALQAQTNELQTSQTSLQAEITRNARLSQNCSDLEIRVQEKDEQVRSLEEKHLHARDALDHYRNAVKEQREQEQRRHEGQIQQIQVELRQMQQTLIIKQDELTRLNRDNERLLSESRQQVKALDSSENAVHRLTGEIQGLKLAKAKAGGREESLREQFGQLRGEVESMREFVEQANLQAADAQALLTAAQAELAQLHASQSASVEQQS